MSFHKYPDRLRIVLALTAGSLLCSSSAEEAGTADHVIYLLMSGGMSRYETFDPKEKARIDLPEAPLPIPTKIPGCEISATLPQTAAILDRFLLLRSVETAGTHVEDQAAYFRRTGYRYRTTVEYPELGAWIAAAKPDGTYFRLNNDREAGAAFFVASNVAPVVIHSPALLPSLFLDTERWKQRVELFRKIGKAKGKPTSEPEIVAGVLARKNVREALDWKNHPKEEAKPYGDNDFGASCFLARRLVEMADATFVEVTLPGWDVAGGEGYFSRLEEQCKILDRALSALILDLEKRDMLSTTLVVLGSDYDRTANLRNGARGPFSQHSVGLLCGGGIEGGKVIGETDEKGYRAINRNQNVTARNFNGLIARALRIDPFRQDYTPSGRPCSISDSGKSQLVNIFASP